MGWLPVSLGAFVTATYIVLSNTRLVTTVLANNLLSLQAFRFLEQCCCIVLYCIFIYSKYHTYDSRLVILLYILNILITEFFDSVMYVIYEVCMH
jgi:hypothetical protein